MVYTTIRAARSFTAARAYLMAALLAAIPHFYKGTVSAGGGDVNFNGAGPCAAAGARRGGLSSLGYPGDAPSPSCVEMRPRRSLDRQTLLIDGPGRLYALKDTRPGAAYEVRVSYPATVPVDITLELVAPRTEVRGERRTTTTTHTGTTATVRATVPPLVGDLSGVWSWAFWAPRVVNRAPVTTKDDDDDDRVSLLRRRLLNVEKMVLSEGDVEDGTHADAGGGVGSAAVVRVAARASGAHRDGPRGGPDRLVFNIVLEPLLPWVPWTIPERAVSLGVAAMACVWVAVAVEPMLRKLVWGAGSTPHDEG